MDPWVFVAIAVVLVIVSLFRPYSKGERRALQLRRENEEADRRRRK
jgi:hypothetical protein